MTTLSISQKTSPSPWLAWTRAALLRVSKSRFVSISLLIHTLLVLVLGSVVLFRPAPEAPVFESGPGLVLGDGQDAAAPAAAPEASDPTPFDASAVSASSAEVPMDMLTTSAVSSSFQVAPAMAPTASLPGLAGRLKGSPGGTGFGDGGGGGLGGLRTASRKIFNTEVTVKRLGVLIDYSGSMKPYHPHVWKEVEGLFENGVAIVQHGCGIANGGGSGKGMVFQFGKPVANIESLEGWNRGHALSLPKVEKELPGFLMTKGTAYFLGEEKAGMQALETFKANGVDTVYWFADFGDAIGSHEEVERFFKSNKMKLYIQYPKGQADLSEGMRKARETMSRVATATGGGVIEFEFQLPAKK